MNPGTIPKLTKSTKESSWAPKSLEAFKNLASLPSIPSKKPAKISNDVAKIYSPAIENRIAVRVKHRLAKVIIFGSKRNDE